MTGQYAEHLFDKKTSLSEQLRGQFYRVIANDHETGLQGMTERATRNLHNEFNALSQIVTSRHPDRPGYTADFLSKLYTNVAAKGRVHTNDHIQILTSGTLPIGAWNTNNQSYYTESYGYKLSGHQFRIGRFDSFVEDPTQTHDSDMIAYHHPYIEMDEHVLNTVTCLSPILLTQLVQLNDLVNHDYIHHMSTNEHIQRFGHEASTYENWYNSFGRNTTISSYESWHVLVHKRVMDMMYPEGAIGHLHKHGLKFLDELEQFSQQITQQSNVGEAHSMVEHLGLCGALPYMRVGHADTPELQEYLRRLEEIDPHPGLTRSNPLRYRDSPNVQQTLKHHRSIGVNLEHGTNDMAYLRRQQAELVHYAPMFAYLQAPELQDKRSVLQRIFGYEHDKVHEQVDEKVYELFKSLRNATVTGYPTAGF